MRSRRRVRGCATRAHMDLTLYECAFLNEALELRQELLKTHPEVGEVFAADLSTQAQASGLRGLALACEHLRDTLTQVGNMPTVCIRAAHLAFILGTLAEERAKVRRF